MIRLSEWNPAESDSLPHPTASDVHVWRIDTSTLPQRRVLSGDEQARADGFLNDAARTQFVACRTALRTILARYLGSDPAELRFGYGQHGKPFLLRDALRNLRFNCSHSDCVGLIAVTCGREVGVDVEQIRPNLNLLELANRFFAPAETDSIRQTPPDGQQKAFFDCWTRKEAWMKAIGVGLSQPPQTFDVSASLGRRFAQLSYPAVNATTWALHSLTLHCHASAAVAVEAHEGISRR